MFNEIYPNNLKQQPAYLGLRLAEELGEMAEAVRLRDISLAFFANEAIDVFAWLMAIANRLETEETQTFDWLDKRFQDAYKGGCPECELDLCKCEPILQDRVGRLAQEMPATEFNELRGLVLHAKDYVRVFGRRMHLSRIAERPEGDVAEKEYPL